MLRHCRALALVLTMAAFLLAVGCSSTSNPTAGTPTPGGPGGSGAPGTGDIKVGCYFSMTGATATFGESTMNGVRLAVDEINARGGVMGRKLVVLLEDDQGQQDQASLAVQKLINQSNVDVLVGEVASSSSIAGGNIAQSSAVPMVSPSSTNPKVTQVGPYVFRACFTDDFQGASMARFSKDTLKAKTAGILTDKQSDYAKGLSEFFLKTFEAEGGKIVGEEFYIQGDSDFKGQITSLKGLNPDIIFVPGYYTDAALIARQARELGYHKPLVGGDGWDSPKLVEIGGKDLDKTYYSVHVDVTSTDPKVQAFVKAFQDRYKSTPDTLAVLGYDTIYLIADAYKRAGAVDRAKLRDALAASDKFPAISGAITMGPTRDPIKPLVVVENKDGKTVYVTTVQPQGSTATAPDAGTPEPGGSPLPPATPTATPPPPGASAPDRGGPPVGTPATPGSPDGQ